MTPTPLTPEEREALRCERCNWAQTANRAMRCRRCAGVLVKLVPGVEVRTVEAIREVPIERIVERVVYQGASGPLTMREALMAVVDLPRVEELKALLVDESLRRTEGCMERAGVALGIGKTTMYRWRSDAQKEVAA